MKKFISILLPLTLVFILSVPAFAIELESSDNIEYLTVYDEASHSVRAVKHNTITGEYIYGPSISVNDSDTNIEPTALGADVHQDTFLNYEYDIWFNTQSGNEWNLERPNEVFSQAYFKTYQNENNYDMLREYKSDVDSLNAAEWAAIPLIGVAGFNIVKAAITSHAALASGGVLSAAAIASIKSAVTATGAAGVAIGLVCSTYNDCAISYKNVLNNTDNIHY